MSKTNEDRNIYVYYENEVNGKFEKPIKIVCQGYTFPASGFSSREFTERMDMIDPNFSSDYKNGTIKRIDKKQELIEKKEFNVNPIPLKEELPINNYEKKEITQSDDEQEQSNVSNLKVSDKLRGILATGAAVVLLGLGIAGCSYLQKNKGDKDNMISSDATLETTEETEKNKIQEKATTTVKSSINSFNEYSKNHKIENKQIGMTTEEWLAGYIYLNSYNYTIQELAQILEDNPNFYVELSNNYRSFCKTLTWSNVIYDDLTLNKDFFTEIEDYNIYKEYFDLFKKTQKDTTTENKKALDEMTKRIYGLLAETDDKDSIYKTNPGVASLAGHTITTAAEQLNLIPTETYDVAMGIYNYDVQGNLKETHGPIEWTTCEKIENLRLRQLSMLIINQDMTKEDSLKEYFESLNARYNLLKDNSILFTEEDYINYLNKLLEAYYATIYNYNNQTQQQVPSNVIPVAPSTIEITESQVAKEFTEEEKKIAEEEAIEEFEEEYGDRIEQEQAKADGMTEARDKIENRILAQARKNEATADALSSKDVSEICDEVIASYRGSYLKYYTEGVTAAETWGIKELKSIQNQYDAMQPVIEDPIIEEPSSSSSSESSSSSSSSEESSEESSSYFVPTPSDSEESFSENEVEIETTVMTRIRG